jgi:hypothetical protein
MCQYMSDSSALKTALQSRVLKTDLAKWREFNFIQEDTFKELTPDGHQRLKASILANNFTQPFYVWQEPETGQIFCLDGKHRVIILSELAKEGYDIPQMLPATFMYCKDKEAAAKLVLIYSSMYAKVAQQGLFDFIQAYNLDYAELKEQIDIPEFSTDRFEQKFDFFSISDGDECLVPIDDEVLVKEGDLFELGNHRIICGSFLEAGVQSSLMEEQRARIVICDPPYNLPASLYKEDSKHGDFAMAIGEMDDLQFVKFLETIMYTSVSHTVPGAIHYIFMDWRHVWHITSAARSVYGCPEPKQMCVWVKDRFANGSFYRSQQELCFVFSDKESKSLWNKDLLDEGGSYKDDDELIFIFKNPDGAKHLSHLNLKDRIRTNVWRYPSPYSQNNPDRDQLDNHPTPKPVAMISDAILDTTNENELVIDWFLGSGTAIIACEKTGRKCRGTDIEPKYIQSTIKRYINYCEKNSRDIIFRYVNGSLTLNDFNHAKKY